MKHNETTEQNNYVKNPDWPEANQCSWEVEPGTTRIKFNEWSERVLDPGSPDLKASALTTGPHCLVSLYQRKLKRVDHFVFCKDVKELPHIKRICTRRQVSLCSVVRPSSLCCSRLVMMLLSYPGSENS